MAPAKSDKPEASRSSKERAWEALTPALSEWILDAVASMGLKRPTPVQASTIPLFIGNKDVVVEVSFYYLWMSIPGTVITQARQSPVAARPSPFSSPSSKNSYVWRNP